MPRLPSAGEGIASEAYIVKSSEMYEEVQTRLATFGKLSMLSALGRLSSSIQRRFTMALLPCQEQEISLKWKSRHAKLKVITVHAC